MEAYFNELSVSLEGENAYTLEEDLAFSYRLLKKNGVNCCRISSKEQLQMYRFFRENGRRNATDLMFSFFHQPYENSDIEEKANEYLGHRFSCGGKECVGLAYAFVADSLGISLSVEPWRRALVSICVDEQEASVRNLSHSGNQKIIQEWLDSIKEITLVKTAVSPAEKNIDIRDDHGSDVLLGFARKIVRSEYVVEVVNSLKFHSAQRRFIFAVHPNGLVDIVLPWTDQGLGIAVRTTGRNLRETEAIAKILKDKYEKR